MLTRSGRWWSPRRIWYYSDAPPRKTADRPHPTAILLGIISPTIALVALYMSIRSFHISEAALNISDASVKTGQQSMKIGQRAYVTVTDSASAVVPSRGLFIGLEGKHRITVIDSLMLHNLGNTPASLKSVSVDILPVYSDQLSTRTVTIGLSGLIGPKEARAEKFSFVFIEHPQRLMKSWRDPLTVSYTLIYSDVFSEEHTISWWENTQYKTNQIPPYELLEPPESLTIH
jgi:hypothetical protein